MGPSLPLRSGISDIIWIWVPCLFCRYGRYRSLLAAKARELVVRWWCKAGICDGLLEGAASGLVSPPVQSGSSRGCAVPLLRARVHDMQSSLLNGMILHHPKTPLGGYYRAMLWRCRFRLMGSEAFESRNDGRYCTDIQLPPAALGDRPCFLALVTGRCRVRRLTQPCTTEHRVCTRQTASRNLGTT